MSACSKAVAYSNTKGFRARANLSSALNLWSEPWSPKPKTELFELSSKHLVVFMSKINPPSVFGRNSYHCTRPTSHDQLKHWSWSPSFKPHDAWRQLCLLENKVTHLSRRDMICLQLMLKNDCLKCLTQSGHGHAYICMAQLEMLCYTWYGSIFQTHSVGNFRPSDPSPHHEKPRHWKAKRSCTTISSTSQGARDARIQGPGHGQTVSILQNRPSHTLKAPRPPAFRSANPSHIFLIVECKELQT